MVKKYNIVPLSVAPSSRGAVMFLILLRQGQQDIVPTVVWNLIFGKTDGIKIV